MVSQKDLLKKENESDHGNNNSSSHLENTRLAGGVSSSSLLQRGTSYNNRSSVRAQAVFVSVKTPNRPKQYIGIKTHLHFCL